VRRWNWPIPRPKSCAPAIHLGLSQTTITTLRNQAEQAEKMRADLAAAGVFRNPFKGLNRAHHDLGGMGGAIAGAAPGGCSFHLRQLVSLHRAMATPD